MTEQSDDVSEMWGEELDDSKDDAKDSTSAPDDKDAKNAWDVESIRNSWTANQVRLPDSLQRRWNAYYGRVESEVQLSGLEPKFGKDRHYKTLVVALGLRELGAMDTDDVMDAMDELERKGHLED